MASSIVINPLLCFVNTALEKISFSDIINICSCFYNETIVQNAKDEILKHYSERPMRKKSKISIIDDIEDIVNIFKNCNENDVELPTYVTDSAIMIPPIFGFKIYIDKLSDLMKENENLKMELNKGKKESIDENVFFEDTFLIKNEMSQFRKKIDFLNVKLDKMTDILVSKKQDLDWEPSDLRIINNTSEQANIVSSEDLSFLQEIP